MSSLAAKLLGSGDQKKKKKEKSSLLLLMAAFSVCIDSIWFAEFENPTVRLVCSSYKIPSHVADA